MMKVKEASRVCFPLDLSNLSRKLVYYAYAYRLFLCPSILHYVTQNRI